jgi:hypothetical protein
LALAALIIAIVAATVALLSFAWSIGWSIYQHRQLTRGRLHIGASLGYLTGYRLIGLSVSATNQGAVPVTLSSVVIEIPRIGEHLVILEWVVQSPAPLPHLLTPGASWMGFADIDRRHRPSGRLPRAGPPAMEGPGQRQGRSRPQAPGAAPSDRAPDCRLKRLSARQLCGSARQDGIQPRVSKTVSRAEHPVGPANSRQRGNLPFPAGFSVERTGIEPVTSGLQSHQTADTTRPRPTKSAWLSHVRSSRRTPLDTVRQHVARTALAPPLPEWATHLLASPRTTSWLGATPGSA